MQHDMTVQDIENMEMSLFPAMNSTTEAIKYIESQVPVETANEMFSLIMMYHNTLLKELKNGATLH